MHNLLKLCFLLFLLFHLISLSSIAQRHFEWVKTFPNSNCQKLVIDSQKSIIATGNFSGTVDFDAGPGVFNMTASSSSCLYVIKYDTSGQFRWAKQVNSVTSNDIEVDNNGNILVLGYFQGTVDFDPGPGVQNTTVSSTTSFLLKLDHNGNFVWVRQLPLEMTQLEIDAAGNFIIGGLFNGTVDFDPGPGTFSATAGFAYTDMAVVKLDSAGNFIWMKQIKNTGTSTQRAKGLETDPDQNIYFAGYFTSSLDFDPGAGVTNLSSAGSNDAFILKLTPQGNFVWAKQFEGAGTNGISALEVDNNGNIFTTGGFVGSVDFDPGPANYTLTGFGTFRTCFISKLDKNGNFVYAKNLQSGDDFGQAITIDSSNNVYVSGGFQNSVDLDPGPGTYNATGGGLFTIKLDVNGNLAWASAFTSSGPSFGFESVYSGIKVDILKNVYYTSIFGGTVDFDPDPAVYNVTAAATWDMLIHKQSQCGNTLRVINVGTCGSYTLNGIMYKGPGTYYQTLSNSTGCDSIIQLNITSTSVINPLTITTCGSYTFNSRLLTASGLYRDTFPAANGCDSIVDLNLQIKPNPTPLLGNDTALCKGIALTLSPGDFSSYKWNNNTSDKTLTIKDTGTYWVLVTAANGCMATDSIRINLTGDCSNCSLNGRIKIYPSPFRNNLIIDKAQTDCPIRMNLYNMLGQLLQKDIPIQDGLNKLPMVNLAAGIYLIKFHSGSKVLFTKKVIKQ